MKSLFYRFFCILPWIIPTVITPRSSIAQTPEKTLGHPTALLRPDLPLAFREIKTLRFSRPIWKFAITPHCARGLPALPGGPSKQTLLLLQGIQKGHCKMEVWFSDTSSELRTVRVYASEESIPPLTRALSLLEEAYALWGGKRWYLHGQIQSPQEARQIQNILQDHPQEVGDQTTWHPSLAYSFKQQLDQIIADSPYHSSLSSRLHGSSLVLTGSIPPEDRALFEQQIKARIPRLDLRIQSLPSHDPTIFFKATLLEISTQDAQALGLDWKHPSTSLALHSPGSQGIQSPIQWEVALHALTQKGSARILSRPEIAMKVPGEAEFFSGGEFALTTWNRSRAPYAISWKPYGLTVQLKSTHTSSTQVRLEILTESSQIHSSSETSSTYPALKTHRMKTQVDALYDQPLFLSGLYQNLNHQNEQGIPFLSQIPILGPLLTGLKSHSTRQTELIMILIPQKEPTPPQGLLQHWNERTSS